MGLTLLDKVWESHVAQRVAGQPDLLYVDLHLVHEVTSPQAFESLRLAGRPVRRPDLTLATMDHNVATGDDTPMDPLSEQQLAALARNCEEFGVPLYATGSGREGIVHVIGPELGLTQPGMTIVCGDSHTSTHGALGALAFGIGTSEVEHVLATQTLPQRKPHSLRIRFVGELPDGVGAKDIVLAAIGRLGVDGGVGHVIEYAGPVIEGLSMEGRLTICNMSIEAGARAGLIAPDDVDVRVSRGPAGRAARRGLGCGRRAVAAAADRRRCGVRPRARDRRVRAPPAGDLGDEPGHGRAARRRRPGSAGHRRRGRAGRCGARARVHGARAGDADSGDRRRSRLHRLVHELEDRGSPRRGRGRAGAARAPVRARASSSRGRRR